MKFLITLLALVCIVNADANMTMDASPYEAAFLVSDVKNVTITSTVAGK